MTALTLVEAPSPAVDSLTSYLEEVLVEIGAAVRDDDLVLEDGACSDGVRIDRVAVLQRLRAAVAALQMAESVRFARSQTAAQMDQGVDPRVVGRGIADQLALACGCHRSPGPDGWVWRGRCGSTCPRRSPSSPPGTSPSRSRKRSWPRPLISTR